jgi:hypothetical protein
MRIGINALYLQKPMVAASLHLYYLLEGLDAYDRRNEYVLLSPRFRKAYATRFPQLTGDRFRKIEVLTKMARLGGNVEKVWWEQIGLVQAARREKLELLHSPYFAAPAIQTCPTVVTIHDVSRWCCQSTSDASRTRLRPA